MANKRTLILNEQEIAALKQAADRTNNPAELKRLQAVRLYGTGHPVPEIAEIVDTSPTSIYRWASLYRQSGRVELQSKYDGNQNAAKLRRGQKADLRERLHQHRPDEVLPPDIRLNQGQFWTVSDLKIVVKQWYGVTYQSSSSYHRLFKACDFSVQRTAGQYRSQPSQKGIADFEEQVEKKVTDLLQHDPDTVFLTLDQMSLYYQATLTEVWAPRGHTPVVRMTPQRDHVHFYGALDVRGGRQIALPAPEQTSEITADFIRILLMLFPTQTILLLLDRASWNKGPAVREVFAENDRLHVMYFPVACPHLNPQEQIWALAREAISHNHNYTDFDQLVADFEMYLNERLFESNFMDKYGPPPNSTILF